LHKRQQDISDLSADLRYVDEKLLLEKIFEWFKEQNLETSLNGSAITAIEPKTVPPREYRVTCWTPSEQMIEGRLFRAPTKIHIWCRTRDSMTKTSKLYKSLAQQEKVDSTMRRCVSYARDVAKTLPPPPHPLYTYWKNVLNGRLVQGRISFSGSFGEPKNRERIDIVETGLELTPEVNIVLEALIDNWEEINPYLLETFTSGGCSEQLYSKYKQGLYQLYGFLLAILCNEYEALFKVKKLVDSGAEYAQGGVSLVE